MPEICAERYPEENKRIEWVMAEVDEQELCKLVPGAQILVSARHRLNAKVFKEADKAYFHQQCGAGYDNLDLEAAKAMGITVSNSGLAGVIPVAEHAIMLMLAVIRQLPRCHNTMARGEWVFPEMVNRVYELHSKTLGIIGLGKSACKRPWLLRDEDERPVL